MTPKQQITKLDRKIAKLYNQRSELKIAQKRKESQKLVGTCYKTMNRYSSGEEWPLFFRITEVDDENGGTIGTQFEKTSLDRFEFSIGVIHVERYDRISPAEYEKAWYEFCHAMIDAGTR